MIFGKNVQSFIKFFFKSFLFLTLVSLTLSCSKSEIKDEAGIDEKEINETQTTTDIFGIDKGDVTPPGDRD